MYFRQLFDQSSSTYTYLLGDAVTHEAVIIDPVKGHNDLYLSLLNEQKFSLKYILETHVHADHITGASVLRAATGALTAISAQAGTSCADVQLSDGDVLAFGTEQIKVLATPGHTVGCMSYLWRDRVFTGDALLIGGCGRTDFQGGDAGTLYNSISRQIWPLADETLIYPGHDYHHKHVSSVAQERETNSRLSGKSRDEFVATMNQLDLPMPRLISVAVPANLQCGKDVIHAG
jgi:glyoxylase-like metal-dependent hydrolase (beta-lactamase superfamily II)